ncbi:hypothetical protein RIF29_41214 [Crotalaria pallida]|uniref:MAGE domain-containing protein n=1 Tax=Crotalaria pallida TaxID=3830 RepID=A0AAN9HV16_CROPI
MRVWTYAYEGKLLTKRVCASLGGRMKHLLKVNSVSPRPSIFTRSQPFSVASVCQCQQTFISFLMASSSQDFSQFGISKEEKDKLVEELIRYMLFKTHGSSGCPVKRDELTRLVTKNYQKHNFSTYVINEAREKLSSIFGYEMRELHRSIPSSKTQARLSQQSVADAKSYILISQLPSDVYEKYVVDADTAHLSGFTFAVISIVYLAGGKMPEENLWSQIKKMGLSDDDKSHPVLGNIKQALELIVQQRYLQKDKVNGPEGSTVYYELAERALDGPISERIKEYTSQIVKDNISMAAS